MLLVCFWYAILPVSMLDAAGVFWHGLKHASCSLAYASGMVSFLFVSLRFTSCGVRTTSPPQTHHNKNTSTTRKHHPNNTSAKTSRRDGNRAYSDAHFESATFLKLQKCGCHCSETIIFLNVIFLQEAIYVQKSVTNFDISLLATAAIFFFARELPRSKVCQGFAQGQRQRSLMMAPPPLPNACVLHQTVTRCDEGKERLTANQKRDKASTCFNTSNQGKAAAGSPQTT